MVANLVAPEHLELMNERPDTLVPLVRNAGAVFCGPLSPASVGDYVAGPSPALIRSPDSLSILQLRNKLVPERCEHLVGSVVDVLRKVVRSPDQPPGSLRPNVAGQLLRGRGDELSGRAHGKLVLLLAG